MRTTAARMRGVLVLALVVGGALATSGGTASAAPPESGAYVALGDSFASGDGAPAYEATPACHRSAAAWARQLDADVASITSVDLRACGGATTAFVYGPWTQKKLPAQVNPLAPDPLVKLVTIVIGGNDLGNGNVLTSCFNFACPKPSAPAYQAKINTLKATLVTKVYPAIHAAFPNAVIAHVGYPQLTPPDNETPLNCGWLSKADQTNLAGAIDATNGAIQSAVTAAPASLNVRYVDVRDALADHEMCTAAPYINPKPGLFGAGANTPAHPNAAGQKAIERAVASALLGITLS